MSGCVAKPLFPYGVVEGTGQVVRGDVLDPEKDPVPAVMWMSKKGICIGLPGGEVRNVTSDRYVVSGSPSYGASLLKIHGGTPQFMVSYDSTTLLMDTATNALSTYSYVFDSYCAFNGVYLAAGTPGVVQIDAGCLDGAAQIDASFSSGRHALGGDAPSRTSMAHLAALFAGELTLTLAADDGTPTSYAVLPLNAGPHQCRVPLARGARGKYWQFTLANTCGYYFSLDSLDFDTAPSLRRS